jgi:hypothetical protein
MSYTVSKPDASEYAPYYETYVSKVKHPNVVTALLAQLDDTMNLLHTVSATQALYRYAPGKWSVKEVLGHVIDAERIFSYRALRIARGDKTPLASFDQDPYIVHAGFDRRTWGSLKDEFELVRRATLALVQSFDPEAWMRSGIASDNPITVRALAYIIAGHELHHVGILRTRYLSRGEME